MQRASAEQMNAQRWRAGLLLLSVVVFAAVHNVLAVKASLWAISASMGDEGASSQSLTWLAVLLSWPADLLITNPAWRMRYGWFLSQVNSIVWGIALTLATWMIWRWRRRHEPDGAQGAT
jgi:hypothetical protein